jgi:hypothetical protein
MGSNPCAVYWMDVSENKKIEEIRVVEWGTPKRNVWKKMTFTFLNLRK